MAAVNRVTENLLGSGTRKIGLAWSNAKPTPAVLRVDSAISYVAVNAGHGSW